MAAPMPPPTRMAGPSCNSKPRPSGPRTDTCAAPARAAVPAPRTSSRKAISPASAQAADSARGRYALLGSGSAWSMKNCPGAPTSPPSFRSTSSVYAPTASTRATASVRLSGGMRLHPRCVQVLQRHRRNRAGLSDRLHRGGGAREGGDARDLVADRGLTDLIAVRAGTAAERAVDDQVDGAVLDQV